MFRKIRRASGDRMVRASPEMDCTPRVRERGLVIRVVGGGDRFAGARPPSGAVVGAVWIACPMFASVQNLDFSTLKRDARCGRAPRLSMFASVQNLDFSTRKMLDVDGVAAPVFASVTVGIPTVEELVFPWGPAPKRPRGAATRL